MDIVEKLKKSELIGRSGSGFSTGAKWEIIRNQKVDKIYIICNASEGELEVFKDEYLLKKYPKQIIDGIRVALETFPKSEAYIYLRKDLYKNLGKKLKQIIGRDKIKLFREPGGYLCGEETTLIETIERQRAEPKVKPPYPTVEGLWGKPTLVNNVETFYYINEINKNKYKKTRLICISGDIKKDNVYEVPVNWSVSKILKNTKNYPKNKFFVQVGGGACGDVRFSRELDKPMCGVGSIVIFDDEKTDPIELMRRWIKFYINENCGKCVPCREGVYRINEMLKEPEKIDWVLMRDILEVMQETSFCGLGISMPTGFLDLIEHKKLNKNRK